jgi:hypothetical protein
MIKDLERSWSDGGHPVAGRIDACVRWFYSTLFVLDDEFGKYVFKGDGITSGREPTSE